MKLYEQYLSELINEGKLSNLFRTRIWRLINKTEKAKQALKKTYNKSVDAYDKFHMKG